MSTASATVGSPSGAVSSGGTALLEAAGLTVRFGGLMAVDDVTLQAPSGEVTGLIGPNGAGKTTTFNALCGLQGVERGRVRLDGEDVTDLAPHRRARKGLGRTFQRLETFSLLSVRENILAGAEMRQRADSDQDPAALTDQLIDKLGLGDVAHEPVDALPTGRARLVEVGRTLANGPRVLLLDEPSSGLNESETEELATVLRELTADGLGVLMVEHDMSLVMATCHQIFVLDFGRIIASGGPQAIQANEAVRTAYLGAADSSTPTPSESGESGESATHRTQAPTRPPVQEVPLLEVSGLSAGYGDFDVVEDVSFQVSTGEVFALLGPNGAGKTTTLKAVAGLLAPTGGTVALCGRLVVGADADALARVGVCMVPEGRGIFANLTVAENLWMQTYTGSERDRIEEEAYRRFPRLGERRNQPAGTLSGGEQQMLAMCRALATDPALLILDELSMGLAPIIVAELYEQVAEIAAAGLSTVVVEQFAHEVLNVADTAAVMLHGTIAKVGPPAEIAEDLTEAYLSGSIEPEPSRP